MNELVSKVCGRIPPLWPLQSFVAVNPFVGLSELPFIDAAQKLTRVLHGELLMSADYYREQIETGRIEKQDLIVAQTQLGESPTLNLDSLAQQLSQDRDLQEADRVETWADFLDRLRGGSTASFIVEEISKWCSVYFDEGQSSWRMPWRQGTLYAAWREVARLDANPGLNGWKEFRSTVKGLPDEPQGVIDEVLRKLEISEAAQEEFLHRELLSISGWSSYAAYRVREAGMKGGVDNSLVELLAIRLAYDLALFNQSTVDLALLEEWRTIQLSKTNGTSLPKSSPLLTRYRAQLALENAFARNLINKIREARVDEHSKATPPMVQAVFCIDVRSEVYRRHLESQSKEIETLGFAGFFGMPVEYCEFGQSHGTAQCPVLLLPKYQVREGFAPDQASRVSQETERLTLKQKLLEGWTAWKTSAISCFSFVETIGLFFGAKLVKESWRIPSEGKMNRSLCCDAHLQVEEARGPKGSLTGIPINDQIQLAEGALRGMSLTSGFARLILICGHGSQSNNNPYASSLDCGACGGHAGLVNAQVAVTLLNKPQVREGLIERGIVIPAETWFIAGLHNTTTDQVILDGIEKVPNSHQNESDRLKSWLEKASAGVVQERAPSLGLDSDSKKLKSQTSLKAQDWSAVRPEWGLAGNAAFIVAPRKRTQGLNLEGRVFLHNYEADQDASGAVLELIMTAPMVVTNWINLQYYASTVDNRHFGSGNKTLHNVVGALGIWQGNGGDLQVGLPLQSLHDGRKWRHEPLRLQVFIEASRQAMSRVLKAHPQIHQLAANGWLHLFAMEKKGDSIWRYNQQGEWEPE